MAVELRPVLEPSVLLGRRWDLEEDGEVQLVQVDSTVAGNAEAAWRDRPERRLVDWSWSQIADQSHEVLNLRTADGHVVAMWSCEPKTLISLPSLGACYRLDFLEIDPERRGGVVGYYAAAVACARAVEAGAQAVVLASTKDARGFWEDVVGASVRKIHGWHVPGSLLPCKIERATLEALRSDLDVCEKP